MNTLAHEGPGPWILLFPLIWAAVVIGVATVLRRTGVWRGGRTGRRGSGPLAGAGVVRRELADRDARPPLRLR